MFCKIINMTDPKTNKTQLNVLALTVSSCAISTTSIVELCTKMTGKELNSTIAIILTIIYLIRLKTQ